MSRPPGRQGKLVNIGSLNVDYVYRVRTLPAAGETVAAVERLVFPGGKGLNQSLAAARAGAQVHHLGRVGEDGQMLREVLAEDGVDVSDVEQAAGASGHAMILVDDCGHNIIIVSGGANATLGSADFNRAFDRLEEDDWLLLQNETNASEPLLAMARERDAKVALNLAPADDRTATWDLTGVALLIVNEAEAQAVTGLTLPEAALDHLACRYEQLRVVVTRGSRGLIYREGTQTGHLEAQAVTTVDETAAGDAFVGYLMAALVTGRSFAMALLEGSAAGALATTKPGAAASIPYRDEVLALLDARG